MKDEELEFQNTKPVSVELVRITPARAELMLRSNKTNRRIRKSVVTFYADEMQRGEWRHTHQGIAQDSEGNLLDGQHRLLAVIESGVTLVTYLFIYPGARTAIRLPIDIGIIRDAADILSIDRLDLALLKTLYRIIKKTSVPTPLTFCTALGKSLIPYLDATRKPVAQHIRTFGAASIRAAVVLRMACGVDWSGQYDALIRRDHPVFTPVTGALFNRLIDLSTHGGGSQLERFGLTWHASHPGHQKNTIIRSAAVAIAIEEACASFQNTFPDIFLKFFPGQKGKK